MKTSTEQALGKQVTHIEYVKDKVLKICYWTVIVLKSFPTGNVAIAAGIILRPRPGMDYILITVPRTQFSLVGC